MARHRDTPTVDTGRMSLLCVLETGVDPELETHDALLDRGFARRLGAIGPRYLGKTEDSLEDLVGWLVSLDWTAQREIPNRPMLMFMADGEREFSYYAIPTPARTAR